MMQTSMNSNTICLDVALLQPLKVCEVLSGWAQHTWNWSAIDHSDAGASTAAGIPVNLPG